MTPRPTISLERLRQPPADVLAAPVADSEADGVRNAAAAALYERLGFRRHREDFLHDTPWGTREFAVKDDQRHTAYVGDRRDRA